jgi:hypothetical protein
MLEVRSQKKEDASQKRKLDSGNRITGWREEGEREREGIESGCTMQRP